MKKWLQHTLSLACLLFIPLSHSEANTIKPALDQQIRQFLLQQYMTPPDKLEVTYTTRQQALACESPRLSLMTPSRIWGNITLVAQCDNAAKRFIAIKVQVMAKYVATVKPLKAGQQISEQDVRLVTGQLDKLPPQTLLNAQQVIGRIALRNFAANQPITANMLRRAWQVEAGQSIKIVINGDGYQIISYGKALNNAALNENVNIRMANGSVVTGLVTDRGVKVVL